MLTEEQIDFYHDNGFLHLPQLFNEEEIGELSDELDRLVQDWAITEKGWKRPWRQVYMDPDTEAKSKITAMQDLHLYSAVWRRGVTNPTLSAAMSDLLGPNVELHHSTMHIKPPQSGHPFPMHQDHPFYAHENEKFIDVLIHLGDTSHANGKIRFLAGSHKQGARKHITAADDGQSTPHLPTDEYKLEDTVAVPARRGDVVAFCYYTVHGSYINTTPGPRRIVRVGYRDPHNAQVYGSFHGRSGIMISGYRERRGEEPLLKTV